MNLLSLSLNSQPSPGPPKKTKIFGRPLQKLYRQLLKVPKAPSQPQLIQLISHQLHEQGLNYHPRTIKRQLLGNIEYIPEVLESALLHWLEMQAPVFNKDLFAEFKKEKKALESSSDQSLYVPPYYFIQMADAYLFRHKQLSRRGLALKLYERLNKRGITIGLETLQASLAGKTKKIRKVLEEEMQKSFFEEGFSSPKEIERLLGEIENDGKQEVQKVSVGNISKMVDAFLLQVPETSKRQLALSLQRELGKKGYGYHLSSLQSVLEGKTQKTKQVILETLFEIFKAGGVEEPEKIIDFVKSADPQQLLSNHYVDAEKVPSLIQELVTLYPTLTRRRIALKLHEDLSARHFRFSLNTLQFILAGKTKRVKKIIVDTLGNYLQKKEAVENFFPETFTSAKKGRPSLSHRVLEAYQQFHHAPEKDRDYFHQTFLNSRSQLIQKLWMKKHTKHPLQKSSHPRRTKIHFEDFRPEEPLPNAGYDFPEPGVAFDIEKQFHQLVS